MLNKNIFRSLAVLVGLSTSVCAWSAEPAKKSAGTTQTKVTGNWYSSKWMSESEWKPMVQIGGRATKTSAGKYALGTTIQTEAQLDVWYQRYVGVYLFGAKSVLKTDTTTFGAGLKLPVLSSEFGMMDNFIGGLSLYLVGDYAKISQTRPTGAPADFDENPGVVRYGVGTNIGLGSWGTYLDATVMAYASQGQFYFAPAGAIGYAF